MCVHISVFIYLFIYLSMSVRVFILYTHLGNVVTKGVQAHKADSAAEQPGAWQWHKGLSLTPD